MSEQPTGAERGFMTRLRERRIERRAIRADRRARRKGHMGGGPDDAARQAESGVFKGGGYFSTNPPPKD